MQPKPKKVGIVAEFDPFHNGHKFLIDSVKKRYDSTQIIVAMSQDVLQRGQFASFDKWWRAKMAVQNGADLVTGLPALVSNNSAEPFARGSIELLKTFEIDALAFGSESDNLDDLLKIAHLLNHETDSFKKVLKSKLQSGLSFPKARQEAIKSELPEIDQKLLLNPNVILAIEYLKQLEGSGIEPLLIPRQGSHFKNEKDSKFLSSSEIRNRLKRSESDEGFVPYGDIQLKENFLKTDEEIFYSLLMAQILNRSKEELLEINEINEDIANKLLKIPGNCFNLEEVYFYLKKKNNTYAGIRRILMNLVLGLKKSDVLDYYDLTKPYKRILAFNKNAQSLLKDSDLKLINVAKDEKKLDVFQKQAFDTDKRVLNIRNLVQKKRGFKDDYYKKPFIAYG